MRSHLRLGIRRTIWEDNYRQPPDRLSAFTGPFSLESIHLLAFRSQESSTSFPPTKLSTKQYCQAKRTTLLLRKFDRHKTGPAERAGKPGDSGESEERQEAARTPPHDRQFVAALSPAPAEYRRTEFDRRFGLAKPRSATRRGAPHRKHRPRQDGLPTLWHSRPRDRRGCTPPVAAACAACDVCPHHARPTA